MSGERKTSQSKLRGDVWMCVCVCVCSGVTSVKRKDITEQVERRRVCVCVCVCVCSGVVSVKRCVCV